MIPVGKTFGAWRVEGDGGRDRRGRPVLDCLCTDCGVTRLKIQLADLRGGGRERCRDCTSKHRRRRVVNFGHAIYANQARR